MSSMQAEVLEFDEAVMAPWRPRLRPDEVVERPRLRALAPPTPARAAVPCPSPSLPPRPSERIRREPVRRESARRESARRESARRESGRRELGRRPPVARAGTAPGGRPLAGQPSRRGARPGCRPAPAGRLRLTLRGRLLLTVLALGAAIVLAAVVGAAVDGDGALRLAGESAVVVQPGDTVWDIAVSVAGKGDVRAVVDEIQRLNGLDDTPLVPGQTLRLP